MHPLLPRAAASATAFRLKFGCREFSYPLRQGIPVGRILVSVVEGVDGGRGQWSGQSVSEEEVWKLPRIWNLIRRSSSGMMWSPSRERDSLREKEVDW